MIVIVKYGKMAKFFTLFLVQRIVKITYMLYRNREKEEIKS